MPDRYQHAQSGNLFVVTLAVAPVAVWLSSVHCLRRCPLHLPSSVSDVAANRIKSATPNCVRKPKRYRGTRDFAYETPHKYCSYCRQRRSLFAVDKIEKNIIRFLPSHSMNASTHLTKRWARVKENVQKCAVGEITQFGNRFQCDCLQLFVDSRIFGM